MDLNQIIEAVNALSDENSPPKQITTWVNDAIARINIELGANFPFMDLAKATESPAFPEKYHYTVLLPFATARIKQVDSSQFEYSDLFMEFEANLTKMKSTYTVPDEFKDKTEQEITQVILADRLEEEDPDVI
ncbi:hypothetical protein [Cytobacillus oceanisediminis]|uniref:hypothetical protein n=1 Tax=Cytobacillus oceanisediminis TaxID=665099 RepID=UPI001C2337DF|nr:hypothetical protein [Cytobacillus oceanisediminis]MBU8770331.1 hypothetical protein [Cytobacillus oceanisediminis]